MTTMTIDPRQRRWYRGRDWKQRYDRARENAVQAREMYASGMNYRDIAAALDISGAQVRTLVVSPYYGTDDLPVLRQRRNARRKDGITVRDYRRIMSVFIMHNGSYNAVARHLGMKNEAAWYALNTSTIAREMYERGEVDWIDHVPTPTKHGDALLPNPPESLAAVAAPTYRKPVRIPVRKPAPAPAPESRVTTATVEAVELMLIVGAMQTIVQGMDEMLQGMRDVVDVMLGVSR